MQNIRWFLVLPLCGLLLCGSAALAQETAYTENEAAYTERFADILPDYPLYADKRRNANIRQYAEKLRELGYYPVARVTDDFITTDMGYAIGLFKQQMGIGGGPDLTPLAQAVLDSGEALPPVVAPVFPRNYSATEKGFTPYTPQQLQRLREGSLCGVQGVIAQLTELGGLRLSLTLEMEEDQPPVTVRYTYPKHSSWFLPGDSVVVFGVVKVAEDNTRSLDADLIGFVP